MTCFESIDIQFRQYWKWLLPVPVILIFFPVTGAAATAILLGCLVCVKSSQIYRKTLQEVRKSPEVAELLGFHVQPGLLVMGNVSRMTSGLLVSLSIPLYGSKGQATTFAVAQKQSGKWHFTTLQVQFRNSYIDLLNPRRTR